LSPANTGSKAYSSSALAKSLMQESTSANEETIYAKQEKDTSQNAAIDESKDLLNTLRFVNSLAYLDQSLCGKKNLSELNEAEKLYANSTTNNCLCQTIYRVFLTRSRTTRLIFNQVKPLFLGKILYAPDTPAYRRLIKKANSTFENADTLLKYIGALADTINFVIISLNLDQEQNVELLNERITILIEQFGFNQSTIDIEQILLQTQIIVEQLYLIRNLGYCVELDKFVGYPSESELVNVGGVLLEKSNFWGGFVFQNPEVSGQLPDIVDYKIRMNSSLTHNTAITQARTYTYGASNCLLCNAYFLYGFIYMQDMLEKGIKKFSFYKMLNN
jgi:hypothetical protein